ncbi:MAG: polysaccharide biosynthesis protein [Bacteroidetes bacterium]|nr:MAG: polysaccharide biosynthesis protein [Bacteroidota bacterium]
MSQLKKLASQTAVYGLSQIVGRFINYLLVPLHTALFSTGEYGVNTLMYSYVTFFNVLLTYGMETAFFRFSQKHENKSEVYSTALTSLVSSSLLFSLIFIGFSKQIASLIHVNEHPEYIIYFVLIISFDAISAIPFAFLRQQNKALKFAIIKNSSIFLNILLNLYFLLLCPYVKSHYGFLLPFFEGEVEVGHIFMANLIASAITLPLLWKEIKQIKNAHFSKVLWKQMMQYGLPLMVVGFAGMINEALDRIIISYMYEDPNEGMRATGIYGANYKLSILMSLFIQAFRYAAEPFFFNHAANNDKKGIYAEVMNYFVLVCLVLFLSVTLYIDVFKHFINLRYWEGLNVVPILLLANMLLGIYYNLSIWYKLSDNNNKGAIISIIGAVVTLVANLLLVPVLGYTGSAWATLICYFSMVVICYLMGAKYYPIPYAVARIFFYVLLALSIYFLGNYIDSKVSYNQWFNYSIKAVIIILFVTIGLITEKRMKKALNRIPMN